MSVPNVPPDDSPEGASPAGRGYWFTPLPTYLLDAVYDPASPVNAPAAILWAHIHRHYAWRERIFPSCAKLAEETGLGERTIARLLQALRSAGALTWDAGFSPKGRSSNRYALAPFKPFEFDREPSPSVPAKSGNHSGEPAKSGSHRPAKSGSHPSAKNGRGIESSSYLESTEESLSPPPSPEPRAVPAAAASEEREISASPKLSTAQQIVRAAAVVDEAEEAAFLDWVAAVHEPRSNAWWRTVAANGDLPGLVDAFRAEHAPASTQPSAGRVLPPWCRDPDCSEIDRQREREDKNGFRINYPCPNCHPDAAPTWASSGGGSLADHNRGVLDRYRARVSGHQPYRDPEDHSVYDLGFDGRPLPGTRNAG